MQRAVHLYGAVAIGSALGAVCRHLCGLWVLELAGPGFPWGTLLVNVAGSGLIGFFATLTGPDGRLFVRPVVRHFVMTGFCGGFTTFSMFSLETLMALVRQDYLSAGLILSLSILSWLVAAWIGIRLATSANRLKGA